MPDAKQVAKFLELQAQLQNPITYGRVLEQFPNLPPFDGNWFNHPLCNIFGEIDAEDHSARRPFRTALVHLVESTPGVGFFKMMEKYRGISATSQSEKDELWITELNALLAYYKNKK